MNFEDFIISPRNFKTENWQIGNQITKDIKEDSIVLLFVSDYRGANGDAEVQDFTGVRKEFTNFHNWILKYRLWILEIWFQGNRCRIRIIFCRKFCLPVITKEPFR